MCLRLQNAAVLEVVFILRLQSADRMRILCVAYAATLTAMLTMYLCVSINK